MPYCNVFLEERRVSGPFCSATNNNTKQTGEKKKQNLTENRVEEEEMEKKFIVFEKKGKFLQVNRAQRSFRAMLCYLQPFCNVRIECLQYLRKETKHE